MPALLTMISSGPRAAMAPPTARSTSAALLVSPWKALARPPALAISEAVSSAEAPSRSSAATGAPAAPRASAMPRPMPAPAPVTTAIRSLSVILSPRLAADHSALASRLRPSARTAACGIHLPSDGQGVAVAAWIGPGHQGARFRVAHDPLPAAHHPRPVVQHVDRVSPLLQPLARRLRNARLSVQQSVTVHP